MRVLLKAAAGLLLFEALLALWLLSAVAVGLLTLQGRVLATASVAQAQALVVAESMALVQGMRANPQYRGGQPHWRHYQNQAPRGCAMGAGSELSLSGEALAQRQLCRLTEGLGQLLPMSDFGFVVCADAVPMAVADWPISGGLNLRCAGSGAGRNGTDSWVLNLVWRVGQRVYVHALRVSHV